MSHAFRRTTLPEHSLSPFPWLPMPDGGSDQGGTGGRGSDDGDDGADDEQDDEQDGEDGSDALGDKGKQALDRMKEERRTLRRELREFKELGLTPAQIKALQENGSKSDDAGQLDPEQIREDARREARAEALRERVTDKIEARAAKRFADAEDAVAILLRSHDPDDFLDGDKVDVEAIQEALDDLLDKKPHLAVQDGKRFKGTADGGTRKESRPAQLTRDDLKRMSPQEIVKAKNDGRLADLLGSK